jgi:hypothetical protein
MKQQQELTSMYLFKSKTINFSLILAILSIVQGYVVQFPFSAIQQSAIGLVLALAIVILRAMTNQPLADK